MERWDRGVEAIGDEARENGWLFGKICGKIFKKILLGAMKYIKSRNVIKEA